MTPVRWFALPDKDIAGQVVTLVKGLYEDQTWRRSRALQSLALYEGRRLEGLHASAYVSATTPGTTVLDALNAPVWNLARSACHTIQAKIAGRQRPKPQFTTSKGNWSTIRRAKKLDRFVEGQLFLPQGPYETAWELGTDVFLDATVWGTGVIKIYADEQAEQVTLERTFQHELYVDPVEARYGSPQSLFHRYTYDKDLLAERFPERRDAIMAANSVDPTEYGSSQRLAEAVEVFEAWRLPLGPDKPGKHVICIDGATLVSEDWTRKEFPFVFLRWSRQRMSFWATSLIEEVESVAEEVNTTLDRMSEAERLCSNGVFIFEEGSVQEEDLDSNEIGVRIRVKPGTTIAPQYVAPNSFSSATAQYLQMQEAKVFELSGVSKLSATSRKEPGVTAAIALRTLGDMETERFSVIARSYEQMYVALARHIVACTRELAARSEGFSVPWPGKRFLSEIRWEDVDLAEDQYVIRLFSVALLPSTPAGKLSTVQDLMNAGLLDPDAAKRLLDWPDLEGYQDRAQAQEDLLEELIEDMLDATPEAQEDGSFVYEAPEPFLKLDTAIAQVGMAYLAAKRDGAPEFNLDLLRRFLTQCDQQAQRIAAAQQPPPGPPAGPPGPPGP